MAEKLKELRVFQAAEEFWKSVNAILQDAGYRKHRKLAEQTTDANDSITANISEGFEQLTDAALARYLFTGPL